MSLVVAKMRVQGEWEFGRGLEVGSGYSDQVCIPGCGGSFETLGPTYCLPLAPCAVAVVENGLRWPAHHQAWREQLVCGLAESLSERTWAKRWGSGEPAAHNCRDKCIDHPATLTPETPEQLAIV